MRSQVLSGGASVGLSALLAGLLLVAAKRDYPTPPVAAFEMRTEPAAPPPDNTQRSADAPTAIVLPDPPVPTIHNSAKNTPKPSKATLKPLVATKNKPAPAMVPLPSSKEKWASSPAGSTALQVGPGKPPSRYAPAS